MGTKNKSAGSQHTPRGIAQGVSLVATNGLPADYMIDGDGKMRLLVDANVIIENATINVDIDSDTDNIAIRNTNNDNELLINADGSINTNTAVNAADGDNVAISGHPAQIFVEDSASLDDSSSSEVVLTYVATSVNHNIVYIEGTGAASGIYQVKLNGTVIRERRSTAANPNIGFKWIEPLRLDNGDTITVEVQPDINGSSFQADYDFFVSLQGFID